MTPLRICSLFVLITLSFCFECHTSPLNRVRGQQPTLSSSSTLSSPQILSTTVFLTHQSLRVATERKRGMVRLTRTALEGYVSPENDPEYQNSIIPSLVVNKDHTTNMSNSFDGAQLLPTPKEGDIVRYPSKWKGDFDVGRLRDLFFSKESDMWMADVLPLIDGKSDNVRNLDRKARSIIEPISNIQPIQSSFVRSENGYIIFFKKNSTEMILKAESYRDLKDDFVFKLAAFNATVLENDLIEYDALKSRIVKNTLAFGALGSLAALGIYGPEVSIPFLCGSIAGALYFVLLGKKTDSIGLGVGMSKTRLSPVEINLGNFRLVVPLLLTTSIAVGNYMAGDKTFTVFQMLSKEQYLGAMFGFMSYFFSILYSEVFTELKSDDLLGFLPGSVATGMRMSKENAAKNKTAEAVLRRALFVSGPRIAGRNSLTDGLIARMNNRNIGKKNSKAKKSVFRRTQILTTDIDVTEKFPSKYLLVSNDDLFQLRNRGDLLFEGTEYGLFGKSWDIALSLDQICSSSSTNSVPVIEGPPEFLDALLTLSGYQISNMWISLQTKEQFIQKATDLVQTEVAWTSGKLKKGREALAKEGGEEITGLVNEAAKDINFYMQKAPLFEFTVLALDDTETLDEVEQVLNASF